jgi:predicted kinase
MESRDLEQPSVVLITGNMASGKSSVAEALARRAPKSVHLRGDVFRKMVVSGRATLGFELSPEARGQLRLRYELSALVARAYVEAGFLVVYQDVVLGPELSEVVASYRGLPLRVFVLQPSPAVIAAREAARPKSGYANVEEILRFDALLRSCTPRHGYWLDSSELSVEQTVDLALRNWATALISP